MLENQKPLETRRLRRHQRPVPEHDLRTLRVHGDVAPRRHRDGGSGGVPLADQQPHVVLLLVVETYGGGPARPLPVGALARLPREHAVLEVEGGVGVVLRGARARFQEALLEVVAEEGVEDRVHGGVRVREAAGYQVDGHDEPGGVLLGGQLRELGNPVGEPAADVDGDDGQHQVGYLVKRRD